MQLMRTRTNWRGIKSAVAKAQKRCDWYKQNYSYVKNCDKRASEQFNGVLRTFMDKHILSEEQAEYLYNVTNG
jgi:fructose-1,6-bisphosphatase/inositol monophosphatase family enzyme